jgi:hypothetical protein
MIISVHLPKTAGKSFEGALRKRFGDALLEDYGSFPINTPRLERLRAALEACRVNGASSFNGVECIHGHFLPLKYLLLAEQQPVTFVTWLRHPVQRVVSHYHYWQRTYDPAGSPPLHRRIVNEGWSLERFCLGEEVRDLYTQFLWGFPVENFAFIGVTEHYNEDLEEFAQRHLGITVTPERLNAGTRAGEPHDLEPGLARRIEAHHARDMALYARVLETRRARRGRHTGVV